MNVVQPAACARAVTGFTESKAGARSIVHSAWNRSLLWLLVRFLPLVVLTCWNAGPAHANGVEGTITSGQTINGAITSKGVDIYSFHAMAGSSFFVSISETGSHIQGVAPEIDLISPKVGDGPGTAHPLYTIMEQTNAAEGTWKVKVSRADKVGGTTPYALTLVQIPAYANGSDAVGAMTSGAQYSGSNTRGQLEVWTFKGVAGHTKTLTLSHTGGEHFVPEAHVFLPTGVPGDGFGCGTGCNHDIHLTETGTYTVVVMRGGGVDLAGNYTLLVADKN